MLLCPFTILILFGCFIDLNDLIYDNFHILSLQHEHAHMHAYALLCFTINYEIKTDYH